jgi:hypothetical protein
MMSNTARELTAIVDDNKLTIQERPASEGAAMLSMIERAARDLNVDVDKFERLMLMKERVEKEAARKAFNAAIAAAKGDIPPIFRNREVDFTSAKGRTNYRHEDFAGIARIIDPILKQHGLTYRHRSEQTAGLLRVTCILSHDDGHFEETSLEAPRDDSGNKNPIQSIGSAATYLQRYTLKLALGLSTSNDDDGRNAAPPADAADLRGEGERIAKEEGFAALGLWWTKTLTQADRKALGPATLNELKAIAEGAN